MVDKHKKSTSSLGFVSGGTLNPSSMDSSITEEDETVENQISRDNSDMELNSDDDILSNVINYDDYIVVDEDEYEYEKNSRYNVDKMSKSTHFYSKEHTKYNQYGNRSGMDSDNTLNDDNIQKIYGKGLNMLKKMGYKGGGLGKDGKGLVKPLLFTTNKRKDNNFTYKIEKSENYETSSASESKVKELDWLTKLQNNYNELINKNENINKNKKEIEINNIKLKSELKLLNEQIGCKLKQLENIKLIKPTIILKYKEYLILLDDTNLNEYINKKRIKNYTNNVDNNNNNMDSKATNVDGNTINMDRNIKKNTSEDKSRKTDTNTNEHTSNNEILSSKIDRIITKLIILLKSLNKIKLNNKLYKMAIKLTFNKIFISEFYYELDNYNKFFEFLPTINKYFIRGYDKYYKEEKEYMNKIYNYYIINELIKYYQYEWNVVNIDEGISIYQQIYKYLNEYYNHRNSDSNGDYDEYGNSNNSDEDADKMYKNSGYDDDEDMEYRRAGLTRNHKKSNNNNGLDSLLKVILNKLVNYIENGKLENIYNCHMVIFSWLQYLDDRQIEILVNTFINILFKNEDNLIIDYELEGERTDKDEDMDQDRGIYVDKVKHKDKVKIYENIYSNWNKLMADKRIFEDKIYNKLYNELNIINFKFYNENKDKLKELINNILEWNRLIGNDNIIRLLSTTIVLKFTKSITLRIGNVADMHNSIDSDDNGDEVVEKKKKLAEQIEDIHGDYIYFKSLLPIYINNNREVQVNYYKTILKSMESLINTVNNYNTSGAH